ncbi:hypothetical protein [Butyrivibrio sp. VCB2006]|uniref:hypothetical protein n=1 Tax=Butyrivibrio sp. VCB2006 TaxID=1280679 RepID=UPI00040F8942|nr:hypothetical protein [Butyrivibrio sp. VCB2006]
MSMMKFVNRSKRKCVIAALVTAMAISGCGLNGLERLPEIIKHQDKASEASFEDTQAAVEDVSLEVETDQSAAEDTTDQQNQEKEPYPYEEDLPDQYLVKATDISNNLYILDENEELLRTYDLNEIKEQVKIENVVLEPYSVVAEKNGVLIYRIYISGKDYTGYYIFAVKPQTGEYKKISQTPNGGDAYGFDMYKGRLCMTVSTGNDAGEWSVKCFQIDEDKFEFTEVPAKYADAYSSFAGYNSQYIYRNESEGESPERILDEMDFILAKRDKSYYRLYKDGTIQKVLKLFGDEIIIMAYDETSVIYYQYEDESYTNRKFYCFNLLNMTSDRIDVPNSANTLAYMDKKLLMADKEETEYGVSTTKLISYDVEKGKYDVLAERQMKPGMHYYYPLRDCFIAAHNKIFFADIVGNKEQLFCGQVSSNNELSIKDLNVVLRESDVFEYGEVKYLSKSRNCPFCDIPIDNAYAEYYVPSADKVRNSELIASDLFDMAQTSINYGNPDAEEYIHEDGCDHDQEYSQMYNMTDDEVIDSVGIIDDRYFYVNYQGYWYNGGAHGMPSKDQYLYDMDTGKRVSLTDFYTGTENELKAIVAQKVKEDYESYAFGTAPYWMENSKIAYEKAYEYSSLNGCIFFGEDGIDYIFYPYDLGSYADGFKTYHITYQELFGREHLVQ